MIIRVKFGKEGALCYIGHLDVLRTFQKIFRRAGIPLAYSQGFSPHPLMSFALPLGLGLSSEGEYLDAELAGEAEEAELTKRLMAATAEELPVYAVRKLPEKAGNAMASVGQAVYRITLPKEGRRELLAGAEALLAMSRIPIRKKTKTQEIELDLRPCVYDLTVSEETVTVTLAAGSRANIKPELFWETLLNAAGLPETLRPVAVRRLDLLDEAGISLGEKGTELP